jgi:hypothetical protein
MVLVRLRRTRAILVLEASRMTLSDERSEESKGPQHTQQTEQISYDVLLWRGSSILAKRAITPDFATLRRGGFPSQRVFLGA